MNNSEFNKVNWINIIIFKIFQDYLNLGELKDLSILSKLTRSKLKSTVFKSIQLMTERKLLDGIFVKSFNSKSYDELNNIVNSDEDEIRNNLDIQNSLSAINYEIKDIKHFANSFYIYDIKRSGQYLSQVITNFINLSVLKIHCSTIQFSIFQKLGEYFPTLKNFELYKVVLSKYSIDSYDSNEIIFPLSLVSLSIWHVDVTNIGILSEPYKVVFNDSFNDARSGYSLPNIYLPFLKKLQFLRCAVEDNGLEEFLQTNPNLEQLHIDTFNQDMSKHFNSLKSLHLEQIDEFENLENLIVHHNIKILNISTEYEVECENFEKLCLMCPSIEFLEFSTGRCTIYRDTFDDYLIPILEKLPNLKTLKLPIEVGDDYFELIDINDFPQIKKIIVETFNLSYLSMSFENNSNLKEIEFISDYYDINKEEFLEYYGSYSEWEFKFFKRKIKGYKI